VRVSGTSMLPIRIGLQMPTPICARINLDCTKNPKCSAQLTGQPCWLLGATACCRRVDKLRCVYCSVYRQFLEVEPRDYVLRPMTSHEPEEIAEASREFYRRTGRRLSDPLFDAYEPPEPER
jgi:hypothetical protein